MPTKVRAYRTDTGELFLSEEDAIAHELRRAVLLISNRIMRPSDDVIAYLRNFPDGDFAQAILRLTSYIKSIPQTSPSESQ